MYFVHFKANADEKRKKRKKTQQQAETETELVVVWFWCQRLVLCFICTRLLVIKNGNVSMLISFQATIPYHSHTKQTECIMIINGNTHKSRFGVLFKCAYHFRHAEFIKSIVKKTVLRRLQNQMIVTNMAKYGQKSCEATIIM